MAGTLGAVLSMVTLSAADATLVLPAASVAVAVRLWGPLVRAAVVYVHVPLALATTLFNGAVPSKTLPLNWPLPFRSASTCCRW